MGYFISCSVCLLALFSTFVASQSKYKIVVTPSGPIKGFLFPVQGTSSSVYQFRGIPYAKPPLGVLRFQKPQSMPPWTETLTAEVFGPACMQFPTVDHLKISENCLFLNVYIPDNSNNNRSVMIFIHGGGYQVGWSHQYDGSYLASAGDVIVVTINYRLSYFGFMSTMDAASPGNYGLWDQHMAMTWVKNNIAAFGGNPSSITIFGESAGGFSVSLQSLYPGNKGLFQNVIAESGVAVSDFSLSPYPKKAAFFVGKVAGCTSDVSTEMVTCMKTKPASDVLQASSNVTGVQGVGSVVVTIMLAPVVDNDFLKDYPIKLLRNQTSDPYKFFKSLNMIIGNVDAEGSLMYTSIRDYPLKKLNFNISKGIPTSFVCNDLIQSIVQVFYSNNQNVSKVLCDFYKVPGGETSALEEQARNAVNLYGDFLFYAPSIASLDIHQQTQNTYQFLLTIPGQYGYGEPYPSWFKGQGHASELVYLFGLQNLPRTTSDQLRLSGEMLKYWTNFAKTGNPNGNNTKTEWPRYNTTSQTYLELNMPLTQKTHVFQTRIDLWTKKIPAIINPPNN